MTGHEPTGPVLEYIHGYFRDNGIYVYFFVDDPISPEDASVTEAEFWNYEMQYNDYMVFDDRASDGTNPGIHPRYNLKEKWVLFGSKVDASWIATNPFGVTTAPADKYGNYIFIAEDRIDEWQSGTLSSQKTK